MLRALIAHALEAVDLAGRGLAHGVGKPALRDAGAVLLDDVLVAALTELLADRGQLLAQQELALRLLHAVGDLGADAVRHLELREGVACPRHDLLQARFDVERLEQLDLAARWPGPATSPRCRRARRGR